MSIGKKQRLDHRVQELMPMSSKQQIQSWIMQGTVLVDGHPSTKAGTLVAPDAIITVTAHTPKFVSRAGFKLEHALNHFGIDVQGLIVLDAGLSTGGFTDCLLQRGAAKVYGVDVGYGQVHEKIRSDVRVVIMERTNLRELKRVGELVDLVTLDLSFISVTKVLDAVKTLLKPQGQVIILIKPQFEAGRADVGRGGIVRDAQVHERVIAAVTTAMEQHGFLCKGVTPSPIEGTTGNKEFLGYFVKK